MVKLDETDQLLLRFVGLYRLGTRSTLASLVPNQTEPDKRIAKFIKAGLLRAMTGLPGNRSVYQLTKKGAEQIGVSPARGRLVGAQSLLKNLGVLLFCHRPGTERYRVEAEQVSQALGAPMPDGAYCLCRVKEKAVVFHCYVPGPQTPVANIVRHLKKQLKAARLEPELKKAVRDLRYGFAVVVGNQQRKKTIMDAVRTPADDRPPLVKQARVWVDVVEELGPLFGTASPRLGCAEEGDGQTSLWTE